VCSSYVLVDLDIMKVDIFFWTELNFKKYPAVYFVITVCNAPVSAGVFGVCRTVRVIEIYKSSPYFAEMSLRMIS